MKLEFPVKSIFYCFTDILNPSETRIGGDFEFVAGIAGAVKALFNCLRGKMYFVKSLRSKMFFLEHQMPKITIYHYSS